jgi:hypothetical protein
MGEVETAIGAVSPGFSAAKLPTSTALAAVLWRHLNHREMCR